MSIFVNLSRQNLLKRKIHPVHLRCLSKSSTTYELFGKSNEKKLFNNKTTGIQHNSQYSTRTSTYAAKKKEFLSFLPGIVEELREKISVHDSEAAEHYARLLQYNKTEYEMFRGVSAVHTYRTVTPKAELTEDKIKLSLYLGWCFQLFEGMFNIGDDIMDGGITRTGRTCWHKLSDVQMSAVNDEFLIEAGVYQILKDHFGHLDCYIKLLENYQDYILIAAIGQYLDTTTMKKNVLSFTLDKYMTIAEYKAGYCYYAPITSALHLAGYTNPEVFNHAKPILFKLGCFAQIQNDFMDCFGDPNENGKNETDIQRGKSTWLIVTCLQRATAAQKKVLEECYGKNDPKCVRQVKQIYEELSIPDLYAEFEKDTYNNIMMLIEKSDEIPAEVYLETVNELFTRGK